VAPRTSPGSRFRMAVAEEKPLQVVGAVNAYAALLAQTVGFKALYVSGGGVAASSCGLPDLGITSMEDVLVDVRRITDACELPVLVDVDTGWGGPFNVARTVRSMIRAGAAALHIEDQVEPKRCGLRPGKAVVSRQEMVDRVKAALDARDDPSFVVMARTDAASVHGVEEAVERACLCAEAGADMIFPEALPELDHYRRVAEAVCVPVLANVTEFGATPLYTAAELRSAGVSLVLYPLSAFRAMSAAALRVYEAVRRDGTQRAALALMQTREDLYSLLGYHALERKADESRGRSAID
jgi:methylisocitrate lyase